MVSRWYRQQSPDYIHLERIKKGNPDYGQRITHLFTRKYKAPHKGFDLSLSRSSNTRRQLSSAAQLRYNQEVLWKYQLSLCFKLLMGLQLHKFLPIPITVHVEPKLTSTGTIK